MFPEKIIHVSTNKFPFYLSGSKSYFVVHNPSSDFEVGETVKLQEFNRATLDLTGRSIKKIISYVENHNDGFIILNLIDSNEQFI